MQAATRLLLRRAPALTAAGCVATPLARAVSADAYPNSFNPEAYMRFPQFLHDINQKLLMYKNSQDTQGLLEKGRLVYSNKCVTVEGALGSLSTQTQSDRDSLKQLSIACKGLFWQSGIDYTCVPCAFPLVKEFTPENFLMELGLDSQAFRATLKCSFFAKGVLHKLPIISYQGEDALNVYKPPLDIMTSILGKYDDVYHLTVGEDVINPVLHFIVAKTESGKLIGFMSASVDE
ncbi:hypothetical protein ACHWQZ_G005310 [Mnemiopsis leidyi]